MFSDLEQQLHQYNSLIKENDELYRDVARSLGLPDCAFWILYFIRENLMPLTQRQICSYLYLPKQTVNSALKNWKTKAISSLLHPVIAVSRSFSQKREQLWLPKQWIWS